MEKLEKIKADSNSNVIFEVYVGNYRSIVIFIEVKETKTDVVPQEFPKHKII